MRPRSISTLLVVACLAFAMTAPAFSHNRVVAMSPSSQSIVGDLSDFIYSGNSGTLTLEKGGASMDFSFGGNLTIDGKNWKSGGMTPQVQGPPIPSSLRLHCSLIRVYYSSSGGQRVATGIKTISNNGSRYFC